jgi:molecular chaperone GrpE
MDSKKPEKNQLKELNQHIMQLTEALQRERADAENIRRRAEEDKVKLSGYFKSEVVKQLMPFIDNFDRALKHAPDGDKDTEQWLSGLKSVEKQLWQVLDNVGVKRIPTVGHPFDPRIHEAIQMEEGSKSGKEVITEEFSPGFMMGDEVIRHAVVKVSSK